MKSNIDLTVVIPVHSVADQNFDQLLHSALMSIENNEIHPSNVIIVRCSCDEVREVLNKLDTSKYSFKIDVIENTEGKQFQKQINFAVRQITTNYFSFLEFDDEFSVKWLTNVKNYTEAYPDTDMFLPIITDVTSDNNFVGFTNEAAWAFNFSETLGQIDHEVLLEYPNINPDGMVIKTEVFKTIGGYKPSIKLTFNYEFLLRFTNSGRNIMVIPKMGYKHTNMRPGSLFWEYKNSIDESFRIQPDEAKFWMDTAKKEYFFSEDRDITYAEEVIVNE
jgi:hypothetical protein